MKYPPISSTVVPALDNTTPMAIFALQDMPLEQSALASVDATLGVSVDTEVERVTEEATDVAVLEVKSVRHHRIGMMSLGQDAVPCN